MTERIEKMARTRLRTPMRERPIRIDMVRMKLSAKVGSGLCKRAARARMKSASIELMKTTDMMRRRKVSPHSLVKGTK